MADEDEAEDEAEDEVENVIVVTFTDGSVQTYRSDLKITRTVGALEIRRQLTDSEGKESGSSIALFAPEGTWQRVERTNYLAR